MRRGVLWLLLAVGVTAALVAVGVTVLGGSGGSGGSDSEPAPAARATPFETTPLASYDVGAARVTRGPFCSGIDPRQVSAALGAAPASSHAWENGDRVAVGRGSPDVAHEFGCEYDGADGTVAEAWAFAPPVAADQGAKLAKAAARAPGCTAASGGPAFGSPSLALTCTAKDGTATASYRGLFGDTWLVCQVTRPAGATWDVADRAGRWCVGVLEGLDAVAPA